MYIVQSWALKSLKVYFNLASTSKVHVITIPLEFNCFTIIYQDTLVYWLEISQIFAHSLAMGSILSHRLYFNYPLLVEKPIHQSFYKFPHYIQCCLLTAIFGKFNRIWQLICKNVKIEGLKFVNTVKFC